MVVEPNVLRVAAVVAAVVLLVVGRVVDLAPSTIRLRMLVATAALPGVTAGRAMPDLPGVATVRGAIREFEVVGERTCTGLRAMLAGGWGRIFFCGVWFSFSLSPPEISWLSNMLVQRAVESMTARLTLVSCLDALKLLSPV